jgi:hypothetical protein
MRRYLLLGLALVALAVPATAMAATLHDPHKNSKCDVTGVIGWHFVNNQTGGASGGTLTAVFSTGTIVDSTPDKVNKNVLHWTVFTPAGATLIDANTGTVPGKLVLSDCFKKG